MDPAVSIADADDAVDDVELMEDITGTVSIAIIRLNIIGRIDFPFIQSYKLSLVLSTLHAVAPPPSLPKMELLRFLFSRLVSGPHNRNLHHRLPRIV